MQIREICIHKQKNVSLSNLNIPYNVDKVVDNLAIQVKEKESETIARFIANDLHKRWINKVGMEENENIERNMIARLKND